MKKTIAMLLCAAMASALLSGCVNDRSGKNATAFSQRETENEADLEIESTLGAGEGSGANNETIHIWHDGDESIMNVIADQANRMLDSDRITVQFEKKTGLTDQIKLYGNDPDASPDLYFYAHDSLGMLVEMGMLAPITDVIDKSVYESMLQMTVKAGEYKGEQYFLPIYFETLLFMYNKDLWQGDIPSTTEDLYSYMKEHTDTEAGTYALLNQYSTAYNVAPFINGYGGFWINDDGQPGLDNENTKKAVEYNKKFAALQSDGDYNTITTLFNDGKSAALIGGPWLVSGIKEAEINFGIKSLSGFTLPNGRSLAPYSGIQGVGVLKEAAVSKKDALAKTLAVLADPKIGIALANVANCAPANQKSYEDQDVKANEMITAMEQTAQTAQPMPNIPQMQVIWNPAESFLAAVNKSGEDVDRAAEKYQKEAESAIADMQ